MEGCGGDANSYYIRIPKKDILEAYFPFTEHRVMLVDDSESQDTDAVSADAVGVTSVPGHNGGAIEVRVRCCRG